MFGCIVEDINVYGINEDGLGSELSRLLASEKDVAVCPHSVTEFVRFVHALRRDKQTLVLKTPANIRYMDIIKRFLPNSRFILMIREPHAAIVSGLARHRMNVEIVARLWLSDCQFFPPDIQ